MLLTVSNIFMTFAWYGHLKYRSEALWKVILASWGIAFFEYCFQVPGNRIGSYEFTTAQLKTIQEVITLSVFSVFSIWYLGEKLVELCSRVCLHYARRILRVPQMVRLVRRFDRAPKRPCPAAGRNAGGAAPLEESSPQLRPLNSA